MHPCRLARARPAREHPVEHDKQALARVLAFLETGPCSLAFLETGSCSLAATIAFPEYIGYRCWHGIVREGA